MLASAQGGAAARCRLHVVAALALAVSSAAADEPYPKPPKEYKTVKMNFQNSKGTSQQIERKGPTFSAYVYLEVPYEQAYDKRVIFTAYVQTMAYSCPWPTACDGQKGGNEYDLIETGFVGFNNTWAKNDNMNCGQCGGSKCQSWGPACRMPGKGCVSGDDKHCNKAMDKQSCPPGCTWSDGQRCISYCTQVVEMDPRYQDNTRFSANSFLGGQTGKKYWYYKCGPGTRVENDQDAYSVITPDGQKYGNRWVKLDLKLDGPKAWYTWTFFQPGPVSNRDVQVAGIQSLMVEHHNGAWGTYDPGRRHVWVFSIWQYVFKTVKAKDNFAIPSGERKIHFAVSEDYGTWPAPTTTPDPTPAPSPAPEEPNATKAASHAGMHRNSSESNSSERGDPEAKKEDKGSEDDIHDDGKRGTHKETFAKFDMRPGLVGTPDKVAVPIVLATLVAMFMLIAAALAVARRSQEPWVTESRELLAPR